MVAILPNPVDQPFALEQPLAYARWRERKLARFPRQVEDLIVAVRDARDLRDSEVAEIMRVCGRASMAIYASSLACGDDKGIVRRLGNRLGLARLHANPLADADGISSLETAGAKSARGYIPYSNRRLLWHTDGYYNSGQERIRSFILHCVRPAARGGENRFLDHEIAYIRLRDENPAYVEALSAPDAMTIPANIEDGTCVRPARTGPVFSNESGALHMRYTARTRSIEWRADARTGEATQFLGKVLEASSAQVFALRLAAGQGLVCNNVLHDRSEYTDEPAEGMSRLIYRARYFDRIAQEIA